MDRTDEKILDLLKGNARMSFQELGDALGMSRVAAKKRVAKLEKAGIIRGYNTAIYPENEITMFIDIVTKPGKYEDVVRYVATRTAFIRQIFRTTMENHIHIVAVSDSVQDLKYLQRMIQKRCGDDIETMKAHAVKEIIKDVYGRIEKYGRRKVQDSEEDYEQSGGSDSEG